LSHQSNRLMNLSIIKSFPGHFAVVFYVILAAPPCHAQNSTRDSVLVKLRQFSWLDGNWEGTGHLAGKIQKEVVTFSFAFDKSSGDFEIRSNSGFAFQDKIHFSSEYHHIKSSSSGLPAVSAYFLGEFKYDNRLLEIIPVNPGYMYVSVVYNRRKPAEAFIMHGAFKKKQ
jgi:hypothetical protein